MPEEKKDSAPQAKKETPQPQKPVVAPVGTLGVPKPSFKDAPAATEGKARTEEDTMKGRLHGRDETGAPAPNQVDQALINEEKHKATNEGRHDQMHDRRWPPMRRAMGVVAPSNPDMYKDLNKAQQADLQEAEKNRQANIKSAEKAASSDKK